MSKSEVSNSQRATETHHFSDYDLWQSTVDTKHDTSDGPVGLNASNYLETCNPVGEVPPVNDEALDAGRLKFLKQIQAISQAISTLRILIFRS
jgi:hypothetical protein